MKSYKINLDELKDEVEEDFKFSITKADEHSLRVPALMDKYSRYMQVAKAAMKKASMQKNSKYRELYDKYKYDDPRKLDKREIEIYIKGNKDFQRLEGIYEFEKMKVEYLESILKAIGQLSWNIGNAIKAHIFFQGG